MVDTDNTKLLKNRRVNEFYTTNIHTNAELNEKEKMRATEYQRERYMKTILNMEKKEKNIVD